MPAIPKPMSNFGFAISEPDLAAAIQEWQRGDYTSCFSIIQRYAEGSHPDAQFILGVSYHHEWGLDRDRDKAVFWFEHAIENGHPTAPLDLALLFDPANELVKASHASASTAEQNYKIGYERCKAGAESGNAELMVALGNCYICGWGTSIDLELAKLWHARALAAGYKGQL